ncbi:ABC transporter ATP-binding protein [Sulfitobacter guttiformis]|uniref:Glutathione import ATP-binding protein GsiA n=1 Tax=Sulfitobacter guttiformis TaxID=74349 RepID=A0A420DTP7_9RHOB|nr:oligopeptide/dipeptide ABC transporter ATP-binding protein [Sulfitobacter guttiformis]KIN71035.1 Oligopeptide/dipeptide transporter domain family protein [Sulfitobacter guttiformis KCTC 32187]RKE97519.1 peptide/nickel transport system ATP-binding protein [Sulfitobacter guttiformis]
MSAFLEIADVSRLFGPKLTTGEKIAAKLGATVETRSVRAVSDVTLSVRKGETLGLVGESGCGKSTLGRLIAGILPPTTGTVTIDGAPVMVKGKKITTRVQTVFQDPFASLDPRMKVGATVAEGPIAHGLTTKADAKEYVAEWFTRVGLDPEWVDRYPHQFSGGQRQRIAIARALAMQPDVLICDEPVASLDVSIQAQIINLFLELTKGLDLTCVFISHDLSVIQHVSDRVAVMYLGRIVELGPVADVFGKPAHPYTAALFGSVPKLVLDAEELVRFDTIEGEVPSPLSPPSGCYYHPRCPLATEACRTAQPETQILPDNRAVACYHFAQQLDAAKDSSGA